MKRIRLFIILLVYIVCLSSCSSNIIGKISGLENEYITIDDVVYELKSNTDFSNADKGKYLGKVSNSKITMKVYEVKGDTEGNYIYTLWDWEGAFYKKVD